LLLILGLGYVYTPTDCTLLKNMLNQQVYAPLETTRAFSAIHLVYAALIPVTLLLIWIHWRENRKVLEQQQSGGDAGQVNIFQL
jgi:hypothetical protein